MRHVTDPSVIDPALDCRAVSFENPTGARGAGGTAHQGRKGAPARTLRPGERVVLADLAGPGALHHLWMTFSPAPPEIMRALWLEVFYDGAPEPSVSVPCLDFFASPHGRPVAFDSAMVSVREGRGFNSYIPMPFRRSVRVELTNGSARRVPLYYQIDYTNGPVADDSGYLHVSFRRENPTVLRRDFVIADGLRGPGRLLGCAVGVRVIDAGFWYGEGEVKVYRDGDGDRPTICGTGLEDYVGSAWGMGAHATLYAGAPLVVRNPDHGPNPDFVSFYRWHLADPIMFASALRVTIQQIGYAFFTAGQESEFERYAATNPAAGAGWERNPSPGVLARGIAERVDDYCATAYVYCREPQPVPRIDLPAALADIGRRPYEPTHPFEAMFAGES
ncbi:MAG TPA: glycoside hydrolase family 172 protein [Candidatus Binatia bacterium]|nr:glycoside hydrolase family 172 protein [Candidatus Binatia bacterium]